MERFFCPATLIFGGRAAGGDEKFREWLGGRMFRLMGTVGDSGMILVLIWGLRCVDHAIDFEKLDKRFIYDS